MVDLLHITPAQMQVFQAQADEAFLGRVAQQQRDHAPPSIVGLDDAGLMRVVRAGVARAKAYGMTWESTLAGFVNIMGDVSPNWDGQPDLHASLLRRRGVADTSFDDLFRDTTEPEWQEAAAMHSGAGWFLPLALPWTQRRERVAGALPAALEPVRPVDPLTALALADSGLGFAFKAGLEGEDAAFLLAAGLAVTGEAKLRAMLLEEAGPSAQGALPGDAGNARRVAVVRAWVRRATGLWV